MIKYFNMNSFGKNLRYLRFQQSMSQQDIANEFNVSISTISIWERGINFPEVAKLIEISEYFGVTTDYLLGLSDYKVSEINLSSTNFQELNENEKLLLDKFKEITPDHQDNILTIIKSFAYQDKQKILNNTIKR